uniref:Uncharacterized protein n=1 Tax=Faxonius propinquus nudivirus TaxID=3139431 RepID=A0AAU8GFL3_9VIRU
MEKIIDNIIIPKLIPYNTNNNKPKDGFKAIVLDGSRYLIHINNKEIQNIYDIKQKNANKHRIPISEKLMKSMIDKIYLYANGQFMNKEAIYNYIFEIVYSHRAVKFIDIFYNECIPELNTTSYKDRIGIMHELINCNNSRFSVIDDKPLYDININNVQVTTFLRCFHSFIPYIIDNIIQPIDSQYNYMVVGCGDLIRNTRIVLKKEPFTSLAQITSIIKQKIINGNTKILSDIESLETEKQIDIYNTLKAKYFENSKEEKDEENNIIFVHSQVHQVHLLAAKNPNNSLLEIFGFAKYNNSIANDINTIIINQPENIYWSDPSFISNFSNLAFYKNIFVVTCRRQHNKYSKNKLTNLIISKVQSFINCNNIKNNMANIDTLPIVEKMKFGNITLNNATNDEIINECRKRLSNILVISNNFELQQLIQKIHKLQIHQNEIKNKLSELSALLSKTEHTYICSFINDLSKYTTETNKNIEKEIMHNIKISSAHHKNLKRRNINNDNKINEMKKFKVDDDNLEDRYSDASDEISN